MSEQIECLNKMKLKIEKDKISIMHEISDARAAAEEVSRSKASSEKTHKSLCNTLSELAKKIEESTLTLNDIEVAKKKTSCENSELLHQLQELDNSANMLGKVK